MCLELPQKRQHHPMYSLSMINLFHHRDIVLKWDTSHLPTGKWNYKALDIIPRRFICGVKESRALFFAGTKHHKWTRYEHGIWTRLEGRLIDNSLIPTLTSSAYIAYHGPNMDLCFLILFYLFILYTPSLSYSLSLSLSLSIYLSIYLSLSLSLSSSLIIISRIYGLFPTIRRFNRAFLPDK